MTGRKRGGPAKAPSAAAELAERARAIAALEAWNAAWRLKDRGVPEGWDDLAWRHPARPARAPARITLEADLLDWLRAIDPDPARPLNAVLRIYMLSLLSREIEAP